MRPDPVLSMLSLAVKAGKVKSGEFAVEKAVKDGTARLVLVAEDASHNTVKSYEDMCAFYQVPLRRYADKERIGRALGKEYRAAACVLDDGFAGQLVKKIDG